jgi:hypothetical protein
MPPVRFEPEISASEQPHTYASDWPPGSAILNLSTLRKKGMEGKDAEEQKTMIKKE